MDIATIIITSITLVTSCLGPLIPACAYLISHIRKSECCGGKLEIREDSKKKLKEKEDIVNYSA
jgi:hypothetical protein